MRRCGNIMKKIHLRKMTNFDTVNARNIPKLPLEQAAALLVMEGITKSADFYNKYKLHEIPKIIPGDPKGYYDNYDGWRKFIQSGKDFLAQGKQPEREPPSFDEMRSLVTEKRISSRTAYNNAVRDGELGILAPSRPDIVYPDEFTTWTAFLAKPGEGRFLSFEDAKVKMKELGVRHSVDWAKLCERGERPTDLPYQPSTHYSGQWRGWKDFLK